MPKEKIVLNINSSSLRYSHCIKAWTMTIQEGWVSPKFSGKIVYGLAVHKFAHTMYVTNNMRTALDAAYAEFDQPKDMTDLPDFYSAKQHLNWICFDLWTNFLSNDAEFGLLLKPDGVPASEVTFSIPFYEDDNIIVNICGTIDGIGKIKGGIYAIRDFKTTGFWDKKKYLAFYRMSHQLRFYAFSLKLMARLFPDSQLGFIGAQKLGAFIDGIFLKEKTVECSVERSEVFMYSDDDMVKFERALVRRIKQLSQAIADGTTHLKEGIVMSTCELKYNLCPFFAMCAIDNPVVSDMKLKQNFIQRPFDPLHRDKATV